MPSICAFIFAPTTIAFSPIFGAEPGGLLSLPAEILRDTFKAGVYAGVNYGVLGGFILGIIAGALLRR